MAVPSARNSGLESTEKLLRLESGTAAAALRMVLITRVALGAGGQLMDRSPFSRQAGCSTGVIGRRVSIVLVSLIWE